MKTRYNIYFEGELLAGHDLPQVRANLGRLFKADEQTLDRLFSGSRQRLKRDCDEQTAQKYKTAMERAGAVAIISKLATSGAAPVHSGAAASESPAAPAATEKKLSTAERIAALAAAKADPRFRSDEDGNEENTPTEVEWASPLDSDGNLALTPPGTEVLLATERPEPVQTSVDTSALHLDNAATRLSEEPPAPPPAPDTSHMAMGEVGDTIPTLERTETVLTPDTSAIGLAPQGTDFSDCAAPEPEPPALDLSAIEVAPHGSDVLDEQYRKRATAAAPDTAHLSLES